MDNIQADSLPEHHMIHHLPLDRSYCENNADALEAVLQELNEMFNPVGTEFSVDAYAFTIDVSVEKFNSVTKRKAGRKSKDTSKQYEEIMAYRETHTAIETAAWLGLTKQTYYRRIKQLKEETSQG
jgi:hypothetical protein